MSLLLLLLLAAANLVSVTGSAKTAGKGRNLQTKQDGIKVVKGLSAEEIRQLTSMLHGKKHADTFTSIAAPEELYNEVLKEEPQRILDGINDFIQRREISHEGIKNAFKDFLFPTSTYNRAVSSLFIAFKNDCIHRFTQIIEKNPELFKTRLFSSFLELAFAMGKKQWTPFLLSLLPEEALSRRLMIATLNNDLDLLRTILRKGYVPFFFRKGKKLDWDMALNLVQAVSLPTSVLLIETLQNLGFDESAPAEMRPELTIVAMIMEHGWLRDRLFGRSRIIRRRSMEEHIHQTVTGPSKERMKISVYKRLGGIKFVLSVASIFYMKETDEMVRAQLPKNLDVSRDFMNKFVREFTEEWVNATSNVKRVRVLSQRGISLPLPSHPFDSELSDQDCKQALECYHFYEIIDKSLFKMAHILKISASVVDELLSDEDEFTETIIGSSKTFLMKPSSVMSATEMMRQSGSSNTMSSHQLISKLSGPDLSSTFTPVSFKPPRLSGQTEEAEQEESLESLVASAWSSFESSRGANMSRNAIADNAAVTSSADLASSSIESHLASSGLDLSGSDMSILSQSKSDHMSISIDAKPPTGSATLGSADMSSSGCQDLISYPVTQQQPIIIVSPSSRSVSDMSISFVEGVDGANEAKSRTVSPNVSPSKPVSKPQSYMEKSMSGSAMSIDGSSVEAHSSARKCLIFDTLKATTDQGRTMDVEIVEMPSEGEADPSFDKTKGPSTIVSGAVADDAPVVVQAGPTAPMAAGNAAIVTVPIVTVDASQEKVDKLPSAFDDTRLTDETSGDDEEGLMSDDESELIAAAKQHSTFQSRLSSNLILSQRAKMCADIIASTATSNFFGARPASDRLLRNWEAGRDIKGPIHEIFASEDDDGADSNTLEVSGSSDIPSGPSLTILGQDQTVLKTEDQENDEKDKEIEEPSIEQDDQELENREDEDTEIHSLSTDYEEETDAEFHERLVRISNALKLNRKRAASLTYDGKEAASRSRASSIPASFKISKEYLEPTNSQPQIVLDGNKAIQQVPSSDLEKILPSEPRIHASVGADAPVVRTVPGEKKAPQQDQQSTLIKIPRPEVEMKHHSAAEVKIQKTVPGGKKIPQQDPEFTPIKIANPEPKLEHHSAAEQMIPKIVKGGNKANQQDLHLAPNKAPSAEPHKVHTGADDDVPSNQSMVDAAFSSVDNLTKFAPVGPYIVTLKTFLNAPGNIFSALTPGVLEKMLFTGNDKFTEFFETEKGLEMLGHLDHEGESCVYEQVGKFFDVLGPKAMASLKKEALMIIMPEYFAHLLEQQFEVLDFSWLLPDQVEKIPAQLFARLSQQQAEQFRSASLERDAVLSPCVGLNASQLNALPSKEPFSALGEVCQKQISHEELYRASKEVISWIPSSYFEQSLAYDQPGLESLIKNANIEQLSHIPQVYVDESLSPFFGLTIDLATFGGKEHRRAMRTISPQTIEIVDPETLKSMGPGDFTLLSDEVRRDITCESFGYIPPTAVPTSEVISLSVQNTKLCPHLTPEHFSDLPSTVSISSACAGKLPKDTWDYLVGSGAKLPSSFLSHATSEHMSILSSISSDSLTVSHWAKLGTGAALGEQHPCESISFADVSDTEEFWKGINLACLSSLPCLDEVTEEQFKLIKTSVRENLPLAVRKDLPEKIQEKFFASETAGISPDQITSTVLAKLSPEEMSSLASNGLAGLPFETLASLNKEHAEIFLTKKDLLEHATARMISSCNPKFLGSLTADQIDLIPAEACAGLTQDHLSNLDISFLPPTSFAFIEPVLFTSLTSEQLERIPEEAWSSSIFKEQVESIEPSVIAKFMHFDQFGADVDPLSPHHPCLGITDGHRSSFGPSVLEAFWSQCKPVFDSHDLERRMTQRTQNSE